MPTLSGEHSFRRINDGLEKISRISTVLTPLSTECTFAGTLQWIRPGIGFAWCTNFFDTQNLPKNLIYFLVFGSL